MRNDNRKFHQLRNVEIITNVNLYAEGSCLIKFGNTHVLCTASLEEKVPPFLKNKGSGWITAEYGMLARSTHSRMNQDPLKPNGREIEIKRLIGRSLRSVVDLKKLGERQIIVDCDVLQADGGTRCAAITGGYVALVLAIKKMIKNKIIKNDPINNAICAVSCGIFANQVMIDLNYEEDSKCEADCNFVINQNFDLIEIQGTAENGSIKFDQLSKMYDFVKESAKHIFTIQNNAIEK